MMKFNSILLTLLITLLLIPKQALATTDDKFTATFENTTSEKARIRILIDAINKKLICKNGNVAEIDKIIGTDYRLKGPKQTLTNEMINIAAWANRPAYLYTHPKAWFQSESDDPWYFYFSYTNNGVIYRYSLSNGNIKSGMPNKVSPSLVQELSERYKKSQSEYRKLEVCLEAINRGVININTPRSTLNELFGPNWNYEQLSCGGKVAFIPFSEAKNCWRLYFFCRDDSISAYFLTNINNYFHSKPEDWWKNHAM